MEIISIGHDNFIPSHRISLILQIDSRPVKNLIYKAREIEKFIDASKGRKRKSAILTTDGYVVLSSMSPKTLALRMRQTDHGHDQGLE